MSDVSNNSKRVQIEHALKNIPKTLIIGYGNPDREDDGVAWHILKGLAKFFGIDFPDSLSEEFVNSHPKLHFLFDLQLIPEMSYEMKEFDRICFVDAHTGALENDLNFQVLERKFQKSPLTHHMTPQTVLSILDSTFEVQPESILVSVRGYQFGFSDKLSTRTQKLAVQAIEKISNWILN